MGELWESTNSTKTIQMILVGLFFELTYSLCGVCFGVNLLLWGKRFNFCTGCVSGGSVVAWDRLLPPGWSRSSSIRFSSFCFRSRSLLPPFLPLLPGASSSSCRLTEGGVAWTWRWRRSCCRSLSRLRTCQAPNSGPTAVWRTGRN